MIVNICNRHTPQAGCALRSYHLHLVRRSVSPWVKCGLRLSISNLAHDKLTQSIVICIMMCTRRPIGGIGFFLIQQTWPVILRGVATKNLSSTSGDSRGTVWLLSHENGFAFLGGAALGMRYSFDNENSPPPMNHPVNETLSNDKTAELRL